MGKLFSVAPTRPLAFGLVITGCQHDAVRDAILGELKINLRLGIAATSRSVILRWCVVMIDVNIAVARIDQLFLRDVACGLSRKEFRPVERLSNAISD